jgi:hypothetical protein
MSADTHANTVLLPSIVREVGEPGAAGSNVTSKPLAPTAMH